MKGLRNTFIFACILVSVISLSIGMCSCKGKEVKPGVYLDSVYSPLEAPLRIKTDSAWDVIIDTQSSKVGAGITIRPKKKVYPYGYAGISKGGDITFRKFMIRLGIDNNGIHRLMMTHEKDSILTGIPGVGNWGETATITRISDTTKPTIKPLFRKGEIYYFDTTLRILKGIKDDSKD